MDVDVGARSAARCRIAAISIIGVVRAIGDVESMEADVHRLDGRLSAFDAEFRRANGKLDIANGSMKSALVTMRAMNRKLQSVEAMRADVHEVAHKFSGSFLFRGVK